MRGKDKIGVYMSASEFKALAFIDLLGFSSMVTSNRNIATKVLDDFYNISYSIIKSEPEVKGNLFSDSLLAYSDNPELLVNTITNIYRECFKKNNSYSYDLSKYFLLLRGGISFGLTNIQERTEAPNIKKSFIVSPALVHSVKMESKVKGSRLLIADSERYNNQQFRWNQSIKSILYEHSTFTFWKKFKYYDSLWFLDLNKGEDEQKSEVEQLMEIAIKLVNTNSGNKKIIDHHTNTLRLALLSYSKFLNPSNNPVLDQILTDFKDEQYWLIWITIFEMIMSSLDNWAFTAMPRVISFYKEVSLKKTWAEVINYINKPGNNHLLDLMNRFLQELKIQEIS
jgi:hypothetical protein